MAGPIRRAHLVEFAATPADITLSRLFVEDDPEQLFHRIVVFVDYSFFEWNNRIVGDGDAFWADFGAALGDVAVPQSHLVLEQVDAIFGIQRVHFQTGRSHEEAGTRERLVFIVFT